MRLVVTEDLDQRIGARMRDALRRVSDFTPANRQVGEVVLNRVKDNFLNGGAPGAKWVPLAFPTLINRARGVSGKAKVWKKSGGFTKRALAIMATAKPLIFTGRLLRSMTYIAGPSYVDVGTAFTYARRLFFGWNGTPPTPARNPFVLLPVDKQAIADIYGRFISSALGGR